MLRAGDGLLSGCDECERHRGDRRAGQHEERPEPAEAEGRPGVLDQEAPGLEEMEPDRAGLHQLQRADEEEERDEQLDDGPQHPRCGREIEAARPRDDLRCLCRLHPLPLCASLDGRRPASHRRLTAGGRAP